MASRSRAVSVQTMEKRELRPGRGVRRDGHGFAASTAAVPWTRPVVVALREELEQMQYAALTFVGRHVLEDGGGVGRSG